MAVVRDPAQLSEESADHARAFGGHWFWWCPSDKRPAVGYELGSMLTGCPLLLLLSLSLHGHRTRGFPHHFEPSDDFLALLPRLLPRLRRLAVRGVALHSAALGGEAALLHHPGHGSHRRHAHQPHQPHQPHSSGPVKPSPAAMAHCEQRTTSQSTNSGVVDAPREPPTTTTHDRCGAPAASPAPACGLWALAALDHLQELQLGTSDPPPALCEVLPRLVHLRRLVLDVWFVMTPGDELRRAARTLGAAAGSVRGLRSLTLRLTSCVEEVEGEEDEEGEEEGGGLGEASVGGGGGGMGPGAGVGMEDGGGWRYGLEGRSWEDDRAGGCMRVLLRALGRAAGDGGWEGRGREDAGQGMGRGRDEDRGPGRHDEGQQKQRQQEQQRQSHLEELQLPGYILNVGDVAALGKLRALRRLVVGGVGVRCLLALERSGVSCTLEQD